MEQQFDSMDFVDYDFSLEEEEKNPNAVIAETKDDKDWLKQMYKHILKMDVGDDSGLKYWLQEIEKGTEKENYRRLL